MKRYVQDGLNQTKFFKDYRGRSDLGSLVLTPSWAGAQTKIRLSIATGGTGGVYYPYGGGMAAVLSRHLPGVEATAEVTAASVDNCKLVAAQKADLGFVMGDSAHDAYAGTGKFKEKLPLRNLAILYSNFMHVVALDGKGINTVADLKGKKISTGAPGSGTEVKALRVLEAYGLNPDKDITRDRSGRHGIRRGLERPENRRLFLGRRSADRLHPGRGGHSRDQDQTDRSGRRPYPR